MIVEKDLLKIITLAQTKSILNKRTYHILEYTNNNDKYYILCNSVEFVDLSGRDNYVVICSVNKNGYLLSYIN